MVTANLLLYTGGAILVLWGAAHITPTRGVVRGFEPTSEDNRRIITMEWVAEGLALCFIGALVLLVSALAGRAGTASLVVYRACGAMLLVIAAWTALTGARTPIVPIKVCPSSRRPSLCCFSWAAHSSADATGSAPVGAEYVLGD